VAALQKAGYTPRFLTPQDLGEVGSRDPGPWDVLKEVAACVLVEPLGERSVFEYILLLRASWETAQIPVAVVTKTLGPDPLRALAFHTLGVAGLAARDAPESLDYLFLWTGGATRSPELQAVLLFADDEARRAGQAQIGTEHLLLGLLRDAGAMRLLGEGRNALPERMTQDLRRRMERGPEYSRHLWRTLTDESHAALTRAREESEAYGGGAVGTEHLLLGLLSHPDTRAGQVLVEHGVTLESMRERARP
jgi:hypothetical protein